MVTARRPDVVRLSACAWCGTALVGQQRRVCSERCRDRLRRPVKGPRDDQQYERARDARYNAEGQRRCTRCETYKAEDEFAASPTRRDGLHIECRHCFADRHHRRRYGVSYDELLAQQDERCKMCGVHASASRHRFAVDHDHACCPSSETCGDCVRGLICRRCNVALGYFEDQELCRRAAAYLGRG